MSLPRALARLLLLAPLFAACGAGPAFPTPGPCPSPTAAPARAATRAPRDESEYRQALFAGVDQLTKLTADFRARWPNPTFYRDPDFRTDFATYADRSTCVAQAMLNEPPPTDVAASFVEAFDSTVRAFISVEAVARDGVRARNATAFREWADSIDGQVNAIRDTFRQFPQQPFGPAPRRTPSN